MTTFTLIAYRPDYDEYCGGYYQGGSSSDLDIIVSDSLDAIVMHTVDYEFNERGGKQNYNYAEWELTLLIDGKKQSYEETEANQEPMRLRDLYDDLVEKGIEKRKQEILEAARKAEEQRVIDEQLRAEKQRIFLIELAEKRREEEYELFLKLKEKYKDVSS